MTCPQFAVDGANSSETAAYDSFGEEGTAFCLSEASALRDVDETERGFRGAPYAGPRGQPAAAVWGALSKRCMFDIGVCEAKQAALIRFSGELTERDFTRLDRIAADARGNAGFDCIFDFTAIERLDLATEFVARRGDLPQAFKDRERIYVVPQADLKLLTRLYAA